MNFDKPDEVPTIWDASHGFHDRWRSDDEDVEERPRQALEGISGGLLPSSASGGSFERPSNARGDLNSRPQEAPSAPSPLHGARRVCEGSAGPPYGDAA